MGQAGFGVLLALVETFVRDVRIFEVVEVGQGALEASFGSGSVTLHEGESAEGGFGPEGGVGFRFVETVFDTVAGSYAAPEEPLGQGEVVDEIARGVGGGVVFGKEGVVEGVEFGGVFSGDEEFLGGASVGGGVIRGDFLALRGVGAAVMVGGLVVGLRRGGLYFGDRRGELLWLLFGCGWLVGFRRFWHWREVAFFA